MTGKECAGRLARLCGGSERFFCGSWAKAAFMGGEFGHCQWNFDTTAWIGILSSSIQYALEDVGLEGTQ